MKVGMGAGKECGNHRGAMISTGLPIDYGQSRRIVPSVLLGLALAMPAAVPAAAPPARPQTLSQACRVREASPSELNQFYNEFNRNGWQGAAIASVPRGYALRGGAVENVGVQFATLYGDVDGDTSPEWVVGCYLPARPAEESAAGPRLGLTDERARLAIFKRAAGRWRLQWQSPGLGYEFARPEFNVREVEAGLDGLETLRLPVGLVNINGDARLEITYHCRSISPSVGALSGVYRFTGGRWASVAPQADRFSLRNVDSKGQLELVTGSPFVGYGRGDDDVPRVWRWNTRREQFEEASRDFPLFYIRLKTRYEAYVRRMEASGEQFDRVAWSRAIQKAISLAG